MWIEVEDEVMTEKLQKFLEFRVKDSEETELRNDQGTLWGYSNVYQLPGIKYELISWLTNEDAFLVRYWKDDERIHTGTGSDYLDCVPGVGGFEQYGPIDGDGK